MNAPDETLDQSGHDGLEVAMGNAAFVMALRKHGVRDTAVLRAMEQVPRADFTDAAHQDLARRDMALPLPCGATMTEPRTVAAMLALLRLEPGQHVLEIGTGSGYVTALLGQIGAAGVTSLERYAGLVARARERLGERPGLRLVHDDGLAPPVGADTYDRILVHGCVDAPAPAWLAMLARGGRIVTGLSEAGACRLVAFERVAGGLRQETGPRGRLAALIPGRARAL